MATPLVAGCVAVVREYLAKTHGRNNPSAALLKALIINAAHNMTGQYAPSEIGAISGQWRGFWTGQPRRSRGADRSSAILG
jgi:serine protease AprX